ncbi:histidine triad nucleotide-binding protein [Selenomonadales bacterium OttesenSCG-928-I06]|nr:histidine triad nucleotide-binding protein [Selenomonadales bacterium OttesenSCG-928-I06]
MLSADCIFCKIASKEIPADIVYEDEKIMVFHDLNKVAPVHVLVIPKKHIENMLDAEQEEGLLGHLMKSVATIAKMTNVAEDGFRLVSNTKENGGQTVPHLHFHLLGGRALDWPPG